MKAQTLHINVQKGLLSELPQEEQDLCLSALAACKDAYAPYSSYHVGAAVLLEDGTVVAGNNQENVAYPSGLCAERTALFYANARYPHLAVQAIALTAVHKGEQVAFISPCGGCRQVLAEAERRFGKPLPVLCFGKGDSIQRFDSVADLLPFSFEM